MTRSEPLAQQPMPDAVVHGEALAQRDSVIALAVRRALPGLVTLAMTVWALQPVSDPDSFWHIAAGDYLRATWKFSGPDPWSTQSSQTWRLHEWLPELVMSWAQQLGGLPAVAWLLPLGGAAILLSLWMAVRERASLLVSAIVMVCAFIAMINSFSLRPQLVTFALTTVVTATWLRTSSDLQPRWWLVPLSLIWACSHGMWFVGPMIGFITVLGMRYDGAITLRREWRLALIPLASVAVAAMTPVGPGLLLSPFQVRGFTQFVQEWLPPSLGDAGFVAFLVLTAACIVTWLRAGRRVPWTQILLTALATGLALTYIRTVPLGAAIMAPLTAAAVQSVSGLRREPMSRLEVALTLTLTAVGLTIVAALSPARAALPGSGANDLNATLDALPNGAVICNEYVLGGWLIWRHPQLKPAIDGRTEVYSLDTVTSYMDFQQGKPGWESYPKKTACSYALLGVDLAPTAGLQKQEGWTAVAASKDYVLLKSPSKP